MSYIQPKPAFVVFMNVAAMDVTTKLIMQQRKYSLSSKTASHHLENTTHHHDTEHSPK